MNIADLMGIAEWVISVLQPSQILMLIALPLTLALAIVEWWSLRRTGRFSLRDSATSTFLGATYILIAEGVVLVLLVVPVYDWAFQFRLLDVPMNVWTFAVLFLMVDLCFYLFHLASHRIRFFWGVHEVHHGSEHFNFTVAFRQSLLYSVTGVYAFFLPPVLLGFHPEWVLLALASNLLLQILPHTEWVGKLPAPVEWLLNTPSNHRVHHARNPKYIDKNLGGVFMIWDHLFGTYVAEDPSDPPEYGTVRQVRSHSILTLTFHEYIAMFRDAARPGPLSLRLKHFWGPPEWQRPATAATDASMSQGDRA